MMIEINDLQRLGTVIAHEGSFKSVKMHFWMIQSAKKEVFGYFLEIGLWDWLDIAYFDRTKCVLTFNNANMPWIIIQKCQNVFMNDPKCQK